MEKTVEGFMTEENYSMWIHGISGRKLLTEIKINEGILRNIEAEEIKTQPVDIKYEVKRAVVKKRVLDLYKQRTLRTEFAQTHSISRNRLDPMWRMVAIMERRQMH